jgi:hypothetical protein
MTAQLFLSVALVVAAAAMAGCVADRSDAPDDRTYRGFPYSFDRG